MDLSTIFECSRSGYRVFTGFYGFLPSFLHFIFCFLFSMQLSPFFIFSSDISYVNWVLPSFYSNLTYFYPNFTGFYRVFLLLFPFGSKSHRFSLGHDTFFSTLALPPVSLDVIGFLPSFTGFYLVFLLSLPFGSKFHRFSYWRQMLFGPFRISFGFTEFYRVLPSFTEFYRVLPSLTKGFTSPSALFQRQTIGRVANRRKLGKTR